MARRKKFSIIVETENLGMAGLGDLEASLDSLKRQTFPIEKVDEVLLIAGGHVSKPVIERLKEKYPWVKIHSVNGDLDYSRSKMKGAEIASGEILIFADSDMRYEQNWLKNMILAFNAKPKGQIVSGDTRLETTSAYNMALNSTWMIQILSDKIDKPTPINYFPLNNFAIPRSIILKTPLPYKVPLYRNKIPLWQKMLMRNGYSAVRAPGTRGYHAPPGNLGDWWYRMLIYGSDFVAQADFLVDDKGQIKEEKNLIKRLFMLAFLMPWKVEQLFLNSYKLLREDFSRTKYLPGGLVLGFANCAVITLGGMCGLLNRNFVYQKITAREEGHIV